MPTDVAHYPANRCKIRRVLAHYDAHHAPRELEKKSAAEGTERCEYGEPILAFGGEGYSFDDR